MIVAESGSIFTDNHKEFQEAIAREIDTLMGQPGFAKFLDEFLHKRFTEAQIRAEQDQKFIDFAFRVQSVLAPARYEGTFPMRPPFDIISYMEEMIARDRFLMGTTNPYQEKVLSLLTKMRDHASKPVLRTEGQDWDRKVYDAFNHYHDLASAIKKAIARSPDDTNPYPDNWYYIVHLGDDKIPVGFRCNIGSSYGGSNHYTPYINGNVEGFFAQGNSIGDVGANLEMHQYITARYRDWFIKLGFDDLGPYDQIEDNFRDLESFQKFMADVNALYDGEDRSFLSAALNKLWDENGYMVKINFSNSAVDSVMKRCISPSNHLLALSFMIGYDSSDDGYKPVLQSLVGTHFYDCNTPIRKLFCREFDKYLKNGGHDELLTIIKDNLVLPKPEVAAEVVSDNTVVATPYQQEDDGA